MSIEKKKNTYFFDGNTKKFSIPCVSEDGEFYLVAVRNEDRGSHITVKKEYLHCEDGESYWQAAAKFAMGMLMRDQ